METKIKSFARKAAYSLKRRAMFAWGMLRASKSEPIMRASISIAFTLSPDRTPLPFMTLLPGYGLVSVNADNKVNMLPHLMLAKRSRWVYPWAGKYMLGPAGRIDNGESPENAMVREAWEELAPSMPRERFENGILNLFRVAVIPHDAGSSLLLTEAHVFLIHLSYGLFSDSIRMYNKDEISAVKAIPYNLIYNDSAELAERFITSYYARLQPHYKYVLDNNSAELRAGINRIWDKKRTLDNVIPVKAARVQQAF